MPINLSGDEFLQEIEAMVAAGATYIDAVTTWCKVKNVEPEVGAELVQMYPLVRTRLQMEAEQLCLVRSRK